MGRASVPTPNLYTAFSRSKLHIPRFRQKRRKLTHSAASPLPTEPASLGFGGSPVFFVDHCLQASPPRFRQETAHGKSAASTPPAQTPQRSFQGAAAGTHATPAPNRAHSGLHGETRGVSDGGGITTLGAFCAVRKPCGAGCQNGILCRFLALVGCTPKERREPAEQRCAHARRCFEASRPRRAA